MSARFTEWLIQMAQTNLLRLQMGGIALAGIIIWEGIRFWPVKFERPGRIIFMVVMGLIYVGLLAFALWALVAGLGLAR
jgi:hypothetical protein